MSKRKASSEPAEASSGAGADASRDKHALVMAEQRLFDVQCYAHDVISATLDLKEGGGIKKSTRAYYDPLLNMEIKMLRDREEELLTRVADLERACGKTNTPLPSLNEELHALRAENEELRNQFGSIGQQMHQVCAPLHSLCECVCMYVCLRACVCSVPVLPCRALCECDALRPPQAMRPDP